MGAQLRRPDWMQSCMRVAADIFCTRSQVIARMTSPTSRPRSARFEVSPVGASVGRGGAAGGRGDGDASPTAGAAPLEAGLRGGAVIMLEDSTQRGSS